ncbi:HECT-domain-containing protein [Anaeromyces robustus]|uniref:E3 ubiquitin-protein ligase HACE1 n=1 Tax=Anaeromyces robustus TaxID=1754192 RepID=A0A1Y1VT75_9FUNG|nr:HECT-domain-containing protein [Anaeromyces robustus]|eukprot:ORX64502.1 HECT-domain-containing protein [Anaeromyces robustus]
MAINNNNIKIIQLLLNYSSDKNIILENYTDDLLFNVAINRNDIKIANLLIDYANEKNITLNIDTILYGKNPLLEVISNNNIEMVKLLINYSNEKNIILKINDKDIFGKYPLLEAVKINNIEIVKLLIDYSNINNIILNVNEKIKYTHDNPLLKAFDKNNIEMVKLLINYAIDKNIILDINDKSENGNYLLLKSVDNNNIEMTKLLIDYANTNNIILNIDDKENKNGDYPLLKAFDNNNIEMVKLLMNYAIDKNIRLNINDKNKNGNYLLLKSIDNNNTEMTKLLIDYANENNIILKIDDKEYKNGNYPLLMAIDNNNIEITKILISYASIYNIILKINDKENKNGNYPLLMAISNNNIEITKLLIDYANKINTILKINAKNKIGSYPFQKASNYNNIEIVRLLKNYAYDHKIKILLYKLSDVSHEIYNILMEKDKRKTNEQELRERIEKELRKKIEKEVKESLERKYREKRNNEQLLSNIYNSSSNTQLKTPTLIIATRDFQAEEYDQLDIIKGEFLMVTNWYEKEGWIFGYRKDHPEEKGLFPKIFIKIYKEENESNSTTKFIITPEYKIQFENKIKKLRSQLDMQRAETKLIITINRNNLFYNAYEIFMNHSPEDLKKVLRIRYEGEEGLDAGGLLRDFFYQLSKEIGNPNYSLFQYSNDNLYELSINPASYTVYPNHLNYFKFIGRILGLSIFHKQYLSVNFTILFYKKLLDIPLEISDLEFIDPEIYKNINWLKENEETENLCLTFSIDTEDCFGTHKKVELKPNGASIDVNDSNKNEYIELLVKYKLNNLNDKEQFEAIKEGFYEIIPKNIKSIINEFDLKYLISGINEIDVNDWENNTDYEGYTKNDITIVNFWKCVRDFKPEKQMKLLLFATGNSQVPVTGFKDLQGSGKIQHFKLKRVGTPNDLPISHTCFNRIDLPPYTTYTQLKQKLLLAISEGMGGFSME